MVIHLLYGVYFHNNFNPPGEAYGARWLVCGLGLFVGIILIFGKFTVDVSEKIFLAMACIFTWHFHYLLDQTYLDFYYLQGSVMILIGCSLLLMRPASLSFYLATSLVVTTLVIARKEDEIHKFFQIGNFVVINFFIYITSLYKIHLVQALKQSHQEVRKRQDQLENNYKLNLQAAHDLASPISAISVAADKIKYEYPKAFRILGSSIEQIKTISADLLLDHRERKESIDADFFDLENNISQIIKDKRQEFRDVSHFFIMYRVTAPVIGQVKLPKSDFYRVLSNIINNAVDAMEEQVEKRIKIVIDPRHDEVSVIISDNGPGILEENVSLIFQENISFKEKGTGLGLSFAKKKVEEWGGQICLKSNSAKGCAFELIIPYV